MLFQLYFFLNDTLYINDRISQDQQFIFHNSNK